MIKNFSRIFAYILVISFLSIITGCDSKNKQKTANNQPREYPVITVHQDSITTYTTHPATIEGMLDVEIRPKVEGYIEGIYIDEGDAVKKGDLLFRINSEEYTQQVRSAQANVKAAEAKESTASMEVKKKEALVKKNIISDYDLESAQYALKSAKATLTQAKADLLNAKTNLGYTEVRSPSDGVIGMIPYRIGSLVSSNMTKPLTMLADISKVHVYFSINEKEFLALNRQLPGANLENRLDKLPPVELVLADGTTYDRQGKIDAISGLVNSSTGAVSIRATFDNPEGLLRSGSSGTIRIPVHRDSVIVIPQQTTYEIQDKHYVYLVGDSNEVHSKSIKVTEDNAGQNFIVDQGLKAGDRIVVEGINALQDDMKIIPKETDADKINKPLRQTDSTDLE